MKSYITGFTDEKIEQIKRDPYFEKKLELIKKKAENQLEAELPRIKFSDMHQFVTTGNRSNYEKAFGEYNSRLDTYSIMYRLTKDEKYLEPLADVIWNICDLETWGLPAHVEESATLDKRYRWVELISSNVGRRFGEVLCLVGEENLPELVVRRMKHEVRERIIEGYKKYDFWWKAGSSNWSAVCISGTLGSFLYFADEEEIKEYLPGMIKTAMGYFNSFDEEGCCMEGYAYWSYGFSYFTYFADLLNNYTNGEINLFKEEKTRRAAFFLENCAINDNQCVRFSDCSEYFRPMPALAHFLKNTYPDLQIPPIPNLVDANADIRGLVWPDSKLKDSTMSPKNFIYHQAQWFIHKNDNYNFVCKAGSNAEPHNHNDVGSFMISKGGKVTFTDPGTGAYTRQYFGAERYTILEPSSRSHSVPIINGKYQVTGKEKSIVVTEEEHEYAFTMQNAYAEETLKTLERRFVCKDSELLLTDTYEFSKAPEILIERFSTLVEPKIKDGAVYCGNTVLVCDNPELFDIELTTETAVRSATSTEPVYLVDFKVKDPKDNMSFRFTFK